MSRLNASIKLTFIIGETFFLLLSLVIIALSALVVSGRVNALDIPSMRQTALLILAISVTMMICVIYGCCGAVNQITRKGFCSGRRVLSYHQVALLVVFVFSFTEIEDLSSRQKSIELVINNVEAYPLYDKFEDRLKAYLNEMYVESFCRSDASSTWIQNWVDQQCRLENGTDLKPQMSMLRREGIDDCASSCTEKGGVKDDRCSINIYEQCRVPILEYVNSIIQYLAKLLLLVLSLSGAMIVLTCLLICYNPRDSIETELLKTGVMTEDDVETMRKLKSETFPYERGNKGLYKINLDKLHQTSDEISGSSLFTQRHSRKRVYPHDMKSNRSEIG